MAREIEISEEANLDIMRASEYGRTLEDLQVGLEEKFHRGGFLIDVG